MSEKKENRDKTMIVRLTKSEYDLIKHLANLTSLSTSQLVRKTMTDRPPKVIQNLPTDKLKMTVNQITRIGNFQKHLDNNILRLIQEKTDLTIEQLVEIKNEQDNYRRELLLNISELKQLLVQILKELR